MDGFFGRILKDTPSHKPSTPQKPEPSNAVASAQLAHQLSSPSGGTSMENQTPSRKRKRSEGVYNYTIQVVCESGEAFDIHQGLLMKHSGRYRAHTANDHTSANLFDVSHYDYDTVDLMKEWMYHGPGHLTKKMPVRLIPESIEGFGEDTDATESPDRKVPVDHISQSEDGSFTSRDDVQRDLSSISDNLEKIQSEDTTSINSLQLTKIYILAEEFDIST